MKDIPITREELKPFMVRSDAKAFRILIWTWASTMAIFAFTAIYSYWPVYILSVFLLAGRQQALAAIMHETAHNTLFATKKYNEVVCKWLCSPFLLMDGKSYIKAHLDHHRNAGTEHDPDLPNYKNYPVTKASLTRKFLRDLVGLTGIKAFLFLLLSGKDLLTMKKRENWQLTRGVCVNFFLFAVLWFCGVPELFALWFIAYLTVYMLIIRFRQIAEHAGVPDIYDLSPKYNTRSLPGGILGFLFISPTVGLSYHCEHHAFMAVPTYNLKPLHELLKTKGYYDDIEIPNGYLSMLKQVVKS